MNRNIIARLCLLFLCDFIFISGHCYGKDSFYAHDEAEEIELIEFVRNHPEIDFATYQTNGMPIIRYAASCNYASFLSCVEEAGSAISRYTFEGIEPPPLAMAMNYQAHEAIDYLASVRPDWVFEPFDGGTVFTSAMMQDNVQQVEKFLNLGVDVQSNRWNKDHVWMDTAGDGSMAMYELLRSRGARFGWDRPFRTERRQELCTKYSGEVLHLYTNKLVMPDGTYVDIVMEPNSQTTSAATIEEILQAVKTVGARCKGTVLMMFHTPNAEPVNFRMEEIVDRANVAIVRIPAGMESTPETWPMEYLPYIPPDQ